LVLLSCAEVKNKNTGLHGASGSRSGAMPATACPDGGNCTDAAAATVCTQQKCDEDGCASTGKTGSIALSTEEQVQGDCKKLVCESGEIRAKDDDTDKPESDGNSCHRVSCKSGEVRATNMEDGTSCNMTGTCQDGRCTTCDEGRDCSRPSDCTIFRNKCVDGTEVCEDTHMPREGRACQPGKVCFGGSCVPCVVGAECDVGTPCYLGRIKSCDNGLECDPQPQSGMTCGSDGAGRVKYCVSGLCTTPCREGPCMTTANECQTSLWDCGNQEASPRCTTANAVDGTPCGDGGACRAGMCAQRALVNGDFGKGLEGWTATGQANEFQIKPDPTNFQRITLSTSSDGGGGGAAIRGSVSQVFMVPMDALALRFNVSGGHAHVRLKDSSGTVIQDCKGVDDEQWHIPVSWDLVERRGQRLTIAIEDDLDSGEFGYVKSTGFDVVRDVQMPLRNSQFADAFEGWETTGDGLYFNLFTDYGYYTAELIGTADLSYGQRLSVSTYARSPQATGYGEASRGTVSQMFLVPSDAVAIRFTIHGGRGGTVSLYRGEQRLETVTGSNTDAHKLPVTWSLEPHRGAMLKIAIEDSSQMMMGWAYIGTTGFDVITSYNGP
jgi:hypothetical protein